MGILYVLYILMKSTWREASSMKDVAIVICWICAIANIVVCIINEYITYKRYKDFVEYKEWIESEKKKLEGMK